MENGNLDFIFENGILFVRIIDEITHQNAAAMREQIDEKIHSFSPNRVVLDFSRLNFMDSSGLGLILGRYQLLREMKVKLVIENPSIDILRLLKIGKVHKIIKIVKTH